MAANTYSLQLTSSTDLPLTSSDSSKEGLMKLAGDNKQVTRFSSAWDKACVAVSSRDHFKATAGATSAVGIPVLIGVGVGIALTVCPFTWPAGVLVLAKSLLVATGGTVVLVPAILTAVVFVKTFFQELRDFDPEGRNVGSISVSRSQFGDVRKIITKQKQMASANAAIDFLAANEGLQKMQGIFRLSGNEAIVQNYFNSCPIKFACNVPDSNDAQDAELEVHNIATLPKRFFRMGELDVMAAGFDESELDKLAKMSDDDKILALPKLFSCADQADYDLVKKYIKLLKSVSDKSEQNRMGIENLAIAALSPMIGKRFPTALNNEQGLSRMQKCKALAEFIIANASQIFPDEVKAE